MRRSGRIVDDAAGWSRSPQRTVVLCVLLRRGGTGHGRRLLFSTKPSEAAHPPARLVTWGWGHHGQLGIAGAPLTHTKSSYFPHEVTLGRDVRGTIVDIGCGHFHAFALTDHGDVYGWGMNEQHQMFGDQPDNVETPKLINPILPLFHHKESEQPKVKKMTGNGVTSALLLERANGATELWTWGSSLYALAHAAQFPRKKAAFAPGKVLGLEGERIIDFALGWGHGLALTSSRKLYAWGWGKNGQLGLGDYENQALPTLVSALSEPVASIAVGPDCSAVVSESGEVFFWGRNEYWMQIKVAWTKGGETMGENLPVKVFFPEKIRITQVRCGYGHLVALDEHGRAWSWGLNKNGQLGLGDTEEHHEPQLVRHFVDEQMKVKQVRCGRVHTVFVTEDGSVWTCGSGVYGRLGHGDKEDQVVPTYVDALAGTRAVKLECGYDFNVALLVPQ